MRDIDRNKVHGKSKKAVGRKHVGPWFRVYAADLDDSRIQLLPVDVKWRWVEMCCLASLSGGVLPSIQQVAFRLRTTEHAVCSALDVLIDAGLLDQSCKPGDTSTRVAGWNERQYVTDRSAPRMRKLRDRNRCGGGDGGCDVTRDGKCDDNAVFSSTSNTSCSDKDSLRQEVGVAIGLNSLSLPARKERTERGDCDYAYNDADDTGGL